MESESLPPNQFGLDHLDDALGGGLPPGTLTVLVAPPMSSAGLVAEQLAAENRPAQYLSSHRPREVLARDLARHTDHSPEGLLEDGSDLGVFELADPEKNEEDNSEMDYPKDGLDAVPAWLQTALTTHSASRTPEATNREDGGFRGPRVLVLDSYPVDPVGDATESVPDAGRCSNTGSKISHKNPVPKGAELPWLHTYARAAATSVVLVVSPEDLTSELGRTADVLLEYRPRPARDEDADDAIVLRRARQSVDAISSLPVSLPLEVTTTVDQNPDESY